MISDDADNCPSGRCKGFANFGQVLTYDDSDEQCSAANAKRPNGHLEFAGSFHCGCYQFGRAPEGAPTGNSVENIDIYKAPPAKDHLGRTFREIALA